MCHYLKKLAGFHLPFIHVPLNGVHFKPLPITSASVIRLPLIRDPSSSSKIIEKKLSVAVELIIYKAQQLLIINTNELLTG